jgi:DNA-binding response OmpR family regulator
VEDEALVSMLVEDMLSDLGVEIVGPVATLEEALAYAREADIDAAVLDINVGGLLTYPVAEILQARGVPIIFSTGYGVDGLPDRFKNVPTLHKPFDLKSFGAALKALLAGTSCELSAA